MAIEKKNRRKISATALTAALAASAIVPAAVSADTNLTDISDLPADEQTAINNLVDLGLIQGKLDGKFDPYASMKRAEIAKVLAEYKGLDEITTDDSDFTDIDGHWAAGYINAAAKANILQGKGEGIFDPEASLTRGQYAELVVNTFNLELNDGAENNFDDIDGHWAEDDIEILYSHGLIKGKDISGTKFGPNESIQRNHVALLTNDTINYVAEDEEEVVLEVDTVSATNATTLEVTLSDGEVHEVTLDEALEANVATEVTFTIDGNEYTETVTWAVSGSAVEKELEEAEANLKAKQEAKKEANQALFDAKQVQDRAIEFGTEAEQKAAKEAVEAATDALNQADKEAQDAFAKVEELREKLVQAKAYDKSLDLVEKAEESFKESDLRVARESLTKLNNSDAKTQLSERLDKANITMVAKDEAEDAIKAIPALEDLTIDYRNNVEAARTAVDKVPKDAQSKIEGLEDLVAAEAKIADLEAEAAPAKEVDDMINDLPAAKNITLENKEAVEAARAAYNDLTDEQKEMVEIENELVNRENKITALEEAKVVQDSLMELPAKADVNFADKDAIEEARQEYTDLEGNRGLVSSEAQTRLTEAEAALDAIEAMDATLGSQLSATPYKANLDFTGYAVKDVESIEFSLYLGDTEQATLVANDKFFENVDNEASNVSVEFVNSHSYWDLDGNIGSDKNAPNIVKATVELKNGRTLELDSRD